MRSDKNVRLVAIVLFALVVFCGGLVVGSYVSRPRTGVYMTPEGCNVTLKIGRVEGVVASFPSATGCKIDRRDISIAGTPLEP